MTRLPLTNARRLGKLLVDLGFEHVRTKGSHAIYKHPDGTRTIVPYHGGKDLPRPLIAEILRQVGLSNEEYARMLREQ
jgi:predicted RNA binding protein YcfA (HicA-like mRNA interferase family)